MRQERKKVLIMDKICACAREQEDSDITHLLDYANKLEEELKKYTSCRKCKKCAH